jgi:hypothetical protein
MATLQFCQAEKAKAVKAVAGDKVKSCFCGAESIHCKAFLYFTDSTISQKIEFANTF